MALMKAGSADRTGFVLGVDGGVASVGWSLLQSNSEQELVDVVALGVRIFESGTDGGGTKKGAEGKDEPRNAARRLARQMRRQTWRRARRKRKLLRALISRGLLPGPITVLDSPLSIHEYIEKQVDAPLRRRFPAMNHRDQQTFFYRLRAKAAAEDVDRVLLGRVLYQLGQRRGFKSNRKADAARELIGGLGKEAKKKAEEERSRFFAEVGDLDRRIRDCSPPTLGVYLASIDPDEARIRGRKTHRKMYEAEFEIIWRRQAATHNLTDQDRAEIHNAIFCQRDLKAAKSSIGRCSLIASERRAPVAHRLFQRFRVLQQMNSLRVVEYAALPRDLTKEERRRLLERLLHGGDLGKGDAKKLIDLKQNAKFNFDEGPSVHFVGHRTDAKLRAAMGDHFDRLDEVSRSRLVREIDSGEPNDVLLANLARPIESGGLWGFPADVAERLSMLAFEPGTASLSLAAIERLLPHLEAGHHLSAAISQEFPESLMRGPVFEKLPPILAFAAAVKGESAGFPEDLLDRCRKVPSDVLARLASVTNPGVLRTLTELRKVVNGVIREYGRPDEIRIELARELKKSKKARQLETRAIEEQTAVRKRHSAKVLAAGARSANRQDVLRSMLWDECRGQCPYTGRLIPYSALFSGTGEIEIEHIWPRSRSLDNSFRNLTLCYADANARKSGRTPFEAFGGSPEWPEILARVENFAGNRFTVEEKLKRFSDPNPPLGEGEDQYRARDLNDTRYASRLAADYLGLLYGGRVDSDGRRRVGVRSGGLTAALRRGWGLDDLLGDEGKKNREDHRHHAIDALVVALSDNRRVKELSEASARAEQMRRREPFADLAFPWKGFRDRVESMLDEVVVSHRQSRRVSGALHEQTLYSPKIGGEHRVRKELAKLSPSIIKKGDIVDQRALAVIRDALVRKLGKAGESPTAQQISQVFGDPANLPLVKGADGKMVRLRKVRVRADGSYVRLGKPGSGTERDVSTASNHHTVIVATLDKNGNDKSWSDEPVSMLEAYRRVAAKEPVVRREVGEGKRVVMSLAQGEFVEIDDPTGVTRRRLICRVQIVTRGSNLLQPHEDATPSATFKAENPKFRIGGERLRKLRARKVEVTPLGEVRPAGGWWRRHERTTQRIGSRFRCDTWRGLRDAARPANRSKSEAQGYWRVRFWRHSSRPGFCHGRGRSVSGFPGSRPQVLTGMFGEGSGMTRLLDAGFLESDSEVFLSPGGALTDFQLAAQGGTR